MKQQKADSRFYYCYELRDPRDDKMFYVGFTDELVIPAKFNLANFNLSKKVWKKLYDLRGLGLKPEFVILSTHEKFLEK